MTVSPQVKIFGLVAALVAVAGALALFMLKPATPEAPPAAIAVPKATAHKAPAAKPAVKIAKAKPVVKKARPVVAAAPASGLPTSLDAALRRHGVVVVSLVVPGATVDEIAAQEARAGAALGNAGYLALNALDESVARPLLLKLGSLGDTSVIVFRRGGEVAMKLSGFADRETVAQAATSAAS